MREPPSGCHGDLNRTERTVTESPPVTLRSMTARTALAAAGVAGAAIAVYLAISALIGLSTRIAVLTVLVVAVVAAVRTAHRPAPASRRERRVRAGSAEGIVDCAGERLRVGDVVRAGAGFDGPMELAFGRGVIVKVGRGKAHVRFNDIPEQVHPVTPTTLRRLS